MEDEDVRHEVDIDQAVRENADRLAAAKHREATWEAVKMEVS